MTTVGGWYPSPSRDSRPCLTYYFLIIIAIMSHPHCNCFLIFLGLVHYAVHLCISETERDIQSGTRIGEAAMSCSKKRFHTPELLPQLIFSYYGYVAYYSTVPFQSCADTLRQGFDAGLSLGDSLTAFFNAIQYMKTAMPAGENLQSLLKRVDYFLASAEKYNSQLAKTYFLIYRGSISTLIDKGESTSSTRYPNATVENKTGNIAEMAYFHRAIQAYYQGHHERCQHYAGKLHQISTGAKFNKLYIAFIHGLNTLQILKRQNTAKLRVIPKNAITTLKIATAHSRWNFRNKVR